MCQEHYHTAAVCWGREPFGYHLTSVLLHAANVLLVWAVWRRLAAEAGPGTAAHGSWLVAATAILPPLLFAVHPLVTEAVCEPTFREDLLVAFFTLAALLLAMHHPAGAAGSDPWRAAAIGGGVAVVAAFLALRFRLEVIPSRIFEHRPQYPGGSFAAAMAFAPGRRLRRPWRPIPASPARWTGWRPWPWSGPTPRPSDGWSAAGRLRPDTRFHWPAPGRRFLGSMGTIRRPPSNRRDARPAVAAAPPVPIAAKADAVRHWREFIFEIAIIVIATLWIYSPAYHGDWLWDDDQAITQNAVAQGPWNFYKHWIWPDGADYWPLTGTGFWIQWHLFGMNQTGYHVVNIICHILGALAVWRLLHVMQLPGAWLGGLVFAIHPVAVESVAWVSEFKNTLSLPLLMLSAAAYVRFDESEKESPQAAWSYAAAVAFYLLAMFAKTSMVMFPFVILLYAWWKHGRVGFRDIAASVPFFLISLVLGLMTIKFQHEKAIGAETILVGDWRTISGLAQRFALAGMSILHYLWKAIWPFDLLTIYPRWDVEPPKAWQFLPWPILGAAVWWLCSQRGTAERPTWQRHMLFVLGFFVLMLFPILGFVTISYMRITWVADHFLYLPMVAVIGFASAAIAQAYAKLSESEQPAALAVAAVMLTVLGVSSFRYAHAWAGEETLWPHTIAGHPAPCTYPRCGCWQAHNRLGAKKFSRGDVPAAHFHFQNSTRLRPDLGETHNNLGTTHSARSQMAAQQGDGATAKREMDLAIEQFREACRVTPHVPAIKVNLANALASAGLFDEAVKNYEELLEKMPQNPALWNNFGVALYKQGDSEKAADAFRRALAMNPNLKDAKEGLAVATGEKPAPQAPPPPGGQLELNLPQSPTLGPMPLQR